MLFELIDFCLDLLYNHRTFHLGLTMSNSEPKIKPYIPHYAREGNTVVLESERDFYDRMGNYAKVTRVVYLDKKGKYHEEDIRVKWIKFVDIKKKKELVHVVKAYVSTMKASNGVFFYSNLEFSNGHVKTVQESSDLCHVLYDIHHWAKILGIKPDVYVPNQHVSVETVEAAYREVRFLL